MPYGLVRSGKGWVVETKTTGKRHSKKPLTRKTAMAQLRAMYAHGADKG